MDYFLVAPDLAQKLDAFFHASDPFLALHAESPELTFMPAANAHTQKRSPFGNLIEGGPLNGQQDRMAHGKRSQTNRAEPNFFGVRRQRGEHRDRFQARLVNQTVADPDGFENARLFRDYGRFDQPINVGKAEKGTPIRQAHTPSYRQVRHIVLQFSTCRRTSTRVEETHRLDIAIECKIQKSICDTTPQLELQDADMSDLETEKHTTEVPENAKRSAKLFG